MSRSAVACVSRLPSLVSRVAVMALAVCLGAQAAEFTPEQDARYLALINELRCLVCQNQAISDSNAPLAEDLRKQVEAQILAGRTDAEIKDYVTARYGDFVLYEPPFKPRTWLLWIGPFLLAALALGVAFGFVRRSHRRAQASTPRAVDAAAVQKILEQERQS